MNLARLQVFQRRCIEHKGAPSDQVSMMVGELDELVHEVFRLRSIVRDVNDATRKASDPTWEAPERQRSAAQCMSDDASRK